MFRIAEHKVVDAEAGRTEYREGQSYQETAARGQRVGLSAILHASNARQEGICPSRSRTLQFQL